MVLLLSAPYLHVNRSCQIANSEIPMGCSLKRYITKMQNMLNIICGHVKLWNRQRDGGNLLLVDGQLKLDTSKPLTKVQTYRILLDTMILRVTERNERPGRNSICLS